MASAFVRKALIWRIGLLAFALCFGWTAWLLRTPGKDQAESAWISPMAGALVSEAGLLSSPESFRLPPLRAPLEPSRRWTLPDGVLKKTVYGCVVALRDETVDASADQLLPAASPANPCWKIVVARAKPESFAERIRGGWSGLMEREKTAVWEFQYLAGPRGTPRGEIRWNGSKVVEIDTRAPTWEVKTARLPIPEGRHDRVVIELLDVGGKSDSPNPDGFFVAGVRPPGEWHPDFVSVKVVDADRPFLLPVTASNTPVRLWTVGEGTGANPEFIPVGHRPQIRQTSDGATATNFDPARLDVEFAILRNPDGSQEADFRKAVCLLAAPDTYQPASEHSQARSETFIFDSPSAGEARFVGRAKIAGEWRLAINGTPVKTSGAPVSKDAEEWTYVEVSGISVKSGTNALTLTAVNGKTFWDFFGLDLLDSRFLEKAVSFSGWPVAPPVARPRDNSAISFDPGVVRQVNGESLVQPRVFGITDHNPPPILKNKTLFETLKAMRLGAIKGPDHVVNDTAPKTPVNSLTELDAYYRSPVPLSQYQTLWNEQTRGWKRQLREAGRALAVERIAVLSGIPPWAQFPGSKGYVGVPKDLEIAARMVSGGIETIRPLWPELHMGYLWNEPDSWWRWEKDIRETANMKYGDYFRAYLGAVRKELDVRCPGFQLGVPSTYAPPINFIGYAVNLDKWNTWWNPLLRQSWKDFDFLDFHAYGFDPRQILANLDVLAAAGTSLHGHRKPVTMTEVGYAESRIQRTFGIQSEPAGWRYRSLPYAHYLVAMAAEPDRLWAALYYDLNNHEFGMFRLDGMEPTSMVDVFVALAPVRGSVLGSDSSDPELTWMACRSGDATISVAITTGERNGGSIPIRLPEHFNGTLHVQRLALNEQLSDVVSTAMDVPLAGGKAELPPMPGSLIVIRCDLGQDARGFEVRSQKEFFADRFVEKLDAGRPSLQWTLSCTPSESVSETGTLRIASFGPESIGNIAFFWNGHPVELSGAFRSQATIPRSWISDKNILEAKFKERQTSLPFVLGSASLLLETK